MKRHGHKMDRIDEPPIVQVNRRVRHHLREGRRILNLGQAVSDLPLPPGLVEALASCLDPANINAYGPDEGLPELRQAIARHLEATFGAARNPDTEIVVTAGANQAFANVILALTDPGDVVLIASPWYFDHPFAVEAAGCRAIPVPTRLEDGFQLKVEALAPLVTPRTRAVVVVTPNNPTGACLPRETMQALEDLVLERGLYLISDETYNPMVFPGVAPASALELERGRAQVVTVHSFSKTLSLAGMRVGHLTAAPDVIEQVLKVQDAVIVCAPLLAQKAALVGLRADMTFHAERGRQLEERRKVVEAGLARIAALEWQAPHGAYFVFPRYAGGRPSLDLVLDILDETGVALIHGSAFGEAGEGHFRLSFGNSGVEALGEALERLEGYFRSKGRTDG